MPNKRGLVSASLGPHQDFPTANKNYLNFSEAPNSQTQQPNARMDIIGLA